MRTPAAFSIAAILVALGGMSAPGRAANPDAINAAVQNESDPRHASHLGPLSFVRGDDEEKAQLLGALGLIEAMFEDSTRWVLESSSGQDALVSFRAVAPVVRAELDRLTQDIAAESRTPGSVSFAEAWAPHFATRFQEDDADEPSLVFGQEAIAIVPLPDEVALHVWFAHAAMGRVWNAFALGSTEEALRTALRRERLWQSFNDIAYSLYPWEQLVNGWRVDWGNLDEFPGWLAIVAHPSVAIEVGTFGNAGKDQVDDLRASEVFLVEFGAQFLRRPGGAKAVYKRGFGIGAVLGLGDDDEFGYGALLHYGTTIHVGTLYREGGGASDPSWSGLVGLDLYGLLRR